MQLAKKILRSLVVQRLTRSMKNIKSNAHTLESAAEHRIVFVYNFAGR